MGPNNKSQVSINFFELETTALEGLEEIIPILPWSRVQERLYTVPGFDAVSELRQAFITLYRAILKFFVCFVNVRTGHGRAIKHALSNKDKFSPFLASIRRQRDVISAYSFQIGREEQLRQSTKLSSVQDLLMDLQRPIVRTDILTMEAARILHRREREKMLDWVSKTPYQGHFQRAREKILKGTGDWLLRHPDYLNWTNSSASRMLWLHGMPGSGKSTLW